MENGDREQIGELLPNPKLRDFVAVGFGLVLAVLIVGAFGGYFNARRLRFNDLWVTHTQEVLVAAESLLSALKDAEVGQRGYLLVEQETDLKTYEAAVLHVTHGLAHLKSLTADNSRQQSLLVVLEQNVSSKLEELRQTIELTKKGDRPAAIKLVAADASKRLMDTVQDDINSVEQAEYLLLSKRAAESTASYRVTVLSIILPAVLGVLLVGVVFYLVQRSISLRQRAAFVLAEQGERLRTTLASIGDAVITTDVNGCVTNLNAVAEALTGWTNASALGQPLAEVFQIVNETTRQPVDNPALRSLREGVIVGLANHTILIAKDGTERPIDDSAAPIKCKLGEIVGCVLVFRDITERKRSEDELHEAGRRKDEFLAMLAHELRNPLAPISNAVSILKLANGNLQGLHQTTEMMERQVNQMVRLIDDLLDVSRVSRGKLNLRYETADLTSIVEQAVETCRPFVESKQHHINLNLPRQQVLLNADSIRLAQVFNNLLNNACKFTSPGGRITLSAERQGSEVTVVIKNNGIGIPHEKLGRIFEMFSQVDNSLERTQNGLGIGLTLVKSLVELHGGTVEAHSEGLGKGSEFIVRLPIVENTDRDSTEEAPRKEFGHKRYRVLVVDDNRDSAESLADFLQLSGNETFIAYDGEAAVEAATTGCPDVILLDIGLPKLNGYDACRRIRKQGANPNMVIVALTGWGQDEDRRKSKEAGFNGHLVKPVDFAELMKLLAECRAQPLAQDFA